MATMTIPVSGHTFISNKAPSADYSGVSHPRTSKYFKTIHTNIAEANWNGNVTTVNFYVECAVLRFQRPNALKYAKITSATLHFKLDGFRGDGTQLYNQVLNQYSLATYATGKPISQIVWHNFKSDGILGEWINGGGPDYYASAPQTYDVSITSLYNGDLSASEFTLAIAAGLQYSGDSVPVNYMTDSQIIPEDCYLTVTYEAGTQPAPSPLYPKDQTLVEADSTLFAWQFNSDTEAVQTAAQLEYKKTTDVNYTVISLTQPDYSHTLNTRLTPGSYQWRVKVTNDAGEASDYSDVAYFNVVGRPASPIINEPANKALTEISWNTTNQQSCEIILADQSGKELYHETLATKENFYKPNFFLKGAYLFSVRVMNDSMMWSDWAQRAFVVSAAGPAAATISLVSAAGVPSVRLTYSIPDGAKGVLMRSCGDSEKIIANLEPLATEYIDDTVAADVVYSYWIRTYVNGYTDSRKLDTRVSFDGAILKIGDAWTHLRTSDEKFLPYSEDTYRDFAILKLSGREYPMIERGEFTTVEFSRRFFVTPQEKKILDRLCKEESVFYRDTKENAFPAGIKQIHYDNYMDEGYIATINLVRLHEEEVVVNV